mmetsp:Transcript_23500/g.36643  ORF Transcript_23500/g.36643 Transcript_23500/m.36643 type:complete len:272 (-) Transcript_23500:70-885(-)
MLCFSMVDLSDLSKVNKELTSQQTLMELIVAQIKGKNAFQNGEKFLEISKWKGVAYSKKKSTVISIDWGSELDTEDASEPLLAPGGEIDLRWIPSTVLEFNISDLEFTGTVETSTLPSDLDEFHIKGNKLTGEFSTEGLPRSLQRVDISRNSFSGSLKLDKLPQFMLSFWAHQNSFSGSINLTSLPEHLEDLTLAENTFSEGINLLKLPLGIRVLRLEGNKLKQSEVTVRSDLRMLQTLTLGKGSVDTIVGEGGSSLKIKEDNEIIHVSFE